MSRGGHSAAAIVRAVAAIPSAIGIGLLQNMIAFTHKLTRPQALLKQLCGAALSSSSSSQVSPPYYRYQYPVTIEAIRSPSSKNISISTSPPWKKYRNGDPKSKSTI
jgi:hypothetical protein